MSSARKLEEAEFFLELLDALTKRGKPLTHLGNAAKEASHLYSAILNAFYSCVVMMRDQEGIKTAQFTTEHPDIYARATDGGERAKTVHVRHIEVSYKGYIPPKSSKLRFDFRKTPVLCSAPPTLPIVIETEIGFSPNYYMSIEVSGETVEVTQYLYDHFYALRSFHKKTHS